MTASRNPFQPAAAVQKKAKILVYGAPGTGKTMFALTFPRVALVDTEGGADLYGGRYTFDVLRTKSFTDILAAIEAVKADNGRTWQTLVIDPITIVWQVLQDAGQQAAEARATRYNRPADDVVLTQRDWGVIKCRLYNAMTDLTNLPVNVILTAHLKDVTEQRRANGAETTVKVGEKPDAEKKTDYYPDIVIKLVVDNGQHIGIIEKDRSGLFKVGQRVPNIGYANFAELLAAHATGAIVQHPFEGDAARKDAPLMEEPVTAAPPTNGHTDGRPSANAAPLGFAPSPVGLMAYLETHARRQPENAVHLINAVRQESGNPKLGYPQPKDTAGWLAFRDYALAHFDAPGVGGDEPETAELPF